MNKMETVLTGLECCKYDCFTGNNCPYADNGCVDCNENLCKDALEMLKKQNEIIKKLLKIGYPHDFEGEEPRTINYMKSITDVMREAVHFRNETLRDGNE